MLIGAVGFWFFTLYRGRLFVRSYMYLMYLECGDTVEFANDKVLNAGFLKASEFAQMAKAFSIEAYNGKRLPVIQEARTKGFLG